MSKHILLLRRRKNESSCLSTEPKGVLFVMELSIMSSFLSLFTDIRKLESRCRKLRSLTVSAGCPVSTTADAAFARWNSSSGCRGRPPETLLATQCRSAARRSRRLSVKKNTVRLISLSLQQAESLYSVKTWLVPGISNEDGPRGEF